jgi:hypothetical protein
MLRTDKSDSKTILTIHGQLTFSRNVLRPKSKEDLKKLLETENIKSVVPLDQYLGIAKLPFKITVDAMLQISYWAQNQLSYQRAEDAISKIMHVSVNDDTVRLVSNFIGNIIFREDCRKAKEAYELLNSCQLPSTHDKKGVLYILTDGAALNTRHKDENNSTWRENKLGEVFSTDHIHFWKTKKGETEHRILQKEYISYIGPASEFKKHLLACALRNGYGRYKTTVVLSDGATWIRNMVDELFPDAQHILDYFHLSENVHTFAKYRFNNNEKEYIPWAESVCQELKASNYAEVLQRLEPYKSLSLPAGVVNLYGYIHNNINNIDYASYERSGYFIGSGAIESGNKTVLQSRLKQAGMRWNIDTAQAMVTLRSKDESALWDTLVVPVFKKYCAGL